VVGAAGFEPATVGLEIRCSIRLSYAPSLVFSSVYQFGLLRKLYRICTCFKSLSQLAHLEAFVQEHRRKCAFTPTNRGIPACATAFGSWRKRQTFWRENQMRAALLVFMLSIPLVQLSAQQQAASATSAEESIPLEPIPQNSPCASQPRSLGELTVSFNKGRAPSAPELVGIWVEVGDFNSGMRPLSDETPPHFRSLNCTGITRGKKFEFAMIGVSYAYVMEVHAYGSSTAYRDRMRPNHKGSVEFSVCRDGDCSSDDVYFCRLTQRGTLACIDGDSGSEFRKMKVADTQIFGVFRP
jgi:hypothetical protein